LGDEPVKFSILTMFLLPFLVGFPQGEKQAIVYVKHLEPPLHYPALGRQAQIQGTVMVKLTIAADGTVLAAEALTRDQDSQSNAHPLLREETEKFVKKWTFGCAYCSPNVPYEKTMRFVYRLEGEGVSYDDTRVVMELPDQVTITASPRECDHCPPKKSSHGETK
jgi:TonB family protein